MITKSPRAMSSLVTYVEYQKRKWASGGPVEPSKLEEVARDMEYQAQALKNLALEIRNTNIQQVQPIVRQAIIPPQASVIPQPIRKRGRKKQTV